MSSRMSDVVGVTPDTPCREAVGHRLWPRGYVQVQLGGSGGKRLLAHRVAWRLAFGPIPNGKLVLHRCDNPPCINPDHLFLGLPQDNADDMSAKGRWQGTQTPERSTWFVTAAQREEIASRHAAGESLRSLCEAFGVSQNTIQYHLRKAKNGAKR
jgi:hypothetical protein